VAPLAAGGVVLVPFPFSDLSQSKLRPAVVLAAAGRDDYILCQVTSNPYADPLAVELTQASFASGSLQRTSYARPGKLFTAHTSLIRTQVGTLTTSAFGIVVERVIRLLKQNTFS
jgi:mRNA interferase MazF